MRAGIMVSVGLFSVGMLGGCEEPEKDASLNLSPSSHQVLLDATGGAQAGGVVDRTRLRDIGEIPVSPPSDGPCKARRRLCDLKNGTDTSVKPVLFVTQVPTMGDTFASRGSTFANHIPSVGSTPRGGDLWVRYPNGQTRNLTKEEPEGFNWGK